MIPLIFPATATTFTDMSRPLTDCVKCSVRQAAGGYDELSMQYPMIGARFAELQRDAIILAKPNPHANPQPYRIYDISRPMSGLVTVSARHLAYDMRGIPVAPFTASSAQDAAQKLKAKALTSCPFTITTDINRTKAMEIEVPKTMRELLVTDADSMLNLYGGGLVFDFYSVSLLASPGADRGVTIRYGVDLVDAQQEENISAVYTGVLPWWQGMKQTVTPSGSDDIDPTITEETVTIVGDVCRAAGTFPVEKILPVDMSEFFEEPPTKAQLNTYGADYVTSHNVGKPVVSLRVSYASLGQDVRLYDTVTVEFPMLGVSTKATVSAAEFDSLMEVYTAVEIGDVQTRITDSLTDASRLKKGKLQKQRIARNSIGGSMLAPGGVSAQALASLAVTRDKLAALAVSSTKIKDDAVIVNKIRNGAVVTDKIADDAVTGIKVLDQAIAYAKLGQDVQVLFTDILAAQAVFAGFLKADGSVVAKVVTVEHYISIAGHGFRPGTFTLQDTHAIVGYQNQSHGGSRNVYDFDENVIGTTYDVYYTGYIYNNGTETHRTYNLNTLVEFWE